jgi:hypothetical protein
MIQPFPNKKYSLTKRESFISEKVEFYQNFLEFRDINWISIDGYKFKNDGKKDAKYNHH